MANCPKCDYKLKLTDWRPNCPKCGINLVYYGMEERLLADADKAESEHAHFQKKIDRVKASFTGSKLAIARIVLTVLPIACLFLPWAKVALTAPYIDKKTTLNAIALFTEVSSMDFGGLFAMMGSDIVGKAFTLFFAALACMLLTCVFALLSLILLFLSCSPLGIRRNITLSSFGLALTVGATYLFTQYNTQLAGLFPGAYNGSLSFGVYVLAAAFVLTIAINAVIAKVGIDVKYKQTYISGIPSEEYFAAIEAGIDINTIRPSNAAAEKEEVEQAAEEAEAADKEKAEAGSETDETAKV